MSTSRDVFYIVLGFFSIQTIIILILIQSNLIILLLDYLIRNLLYYVVLRPHNSQKILGKHLVITFKNLGCRMSYNPTDSCWLVSIFRHLVESQYCCMEPELG
jgi:hypothetical protein